MITLDAYWKGPDQVRRDVAYADEITAEIVSNAEITVERVNRFLEAAGFGHLEEVSSGWRPGSVNAAAGGAARSKHLYGKAIDVRDYEQELAAFCMARPDMLVAFELWMEHPGWTWSRWGNHWCHFQTEPPGIPPNPRARIFIPSMAKPGTERFGIMPVFA